MSEIENQEITPIVDCDVLEAAKENIQPLASGRRVTALSAVLSTPHAQRESQHNSIKSRHRINITIALEGDDPDDDPLEAYCRFVYWTLDAYPQGHSADSGLLELLEEATRVLKDDRNGYWRGDIRYLKLWVLYANFVEKPTVIYKFLLANDIGTQHALLYEEHAAALERAGRCVLYHLPLFRGQHCVQADRSGRGIYTWHGTASRTSGPTAKQTPRIPETNDDIYIYTHTCSCPSLIYND